MTTNPFDLSLIKGGNSPKRQRYSNVWTESEQEDKLKGYLEIPPEYWSTIKGGSHVRYITTNNEFRPGGFILKNPLVYRSENDLIKPTVTSLSNNNEKTGFRLQNFFNKQSIGYSAWNVAYEDISKLYLSLRKIKYLLSKSSIHRFLSRVLCNLS